MGDTHPDFQWKIGFLLHKRGNEHFLVFLCCYDKIPSTGVLMNSGNLFLTFLEAGGLKLGCLHGQVKVLFRTADFLCSHKAEKQGISLIKALISFVRVLPS